MKGILILLFTLVLFSSILADQPDMTGKIEELSSEELLEAVSEAKKDSLISSQDFSELIKEMRKIEGLFNLYVNDKTGKVYLEIAPEQFEQEYLFTLTRQSGDAYFFDAAAMMWSFPFYFLKINNKIQLIEKNLKFRADEPSMKRAVENSISHSIVASTETVGKPHQETGSVLIKAEDIFLIDVANVQSLTSNWKTDFSFDQKNSYFSKLLSFPLNTEIEVALHYKSSKWSGVFTLPDSRSMIHRYHYSLSTLPATDYRPRTADDRIGYFTTIYQDYSDLMNETPYVRYINRWHLEKENPGKKSSPVKEPIVFWLENTIPEQFRPAVKEGVLLWNEAFADIGLENAIVVKEMPDDADWDPADARYNTIRWMIQPGGGYAVGPSHANPYTGEIYDADIRVSVDFLRYFFTEFEEVITPNSWNLDPDRSVWEKDDPKNELPDYAAGLSRQMSLGWNANVMLSRFSSEKDLRKYVEDGLTSLIVHEVGHTLGLRHNFKASTVFTAEQLKNKKFTRKHGICGSVMDYTALNLYQLGQKNADFFQTRVGPWDKWVIEYGYSIFSQDEEAEKLEQIASRCTEPYYDYGTDEDTFGVSTRGLDPLCCIFDLGSDPLAFYQSRIELSKQIWSDLVENFEKEEFSYNKLLRVFNQGLGEYRLAAHNACKFVGGLYSHRDHIGDPEGRPPFVVVEAEKQQQALDFLISNYMVRDAFAFDPELLNKLVHDKYETFTGGIWTIERQDYPIHDKIAQLQDIIFSHLFDPLTIGRIYDNQVKFTGNSGLFTLGDIFQKLDSELWSELEETVSINSYRRQLQRSYLDELREIVMNEGIFPQDAVALARFSLKELQDKLSQQDHTGLDIITRAHLEQVSAQIDSILNAQLEKRS